MANKDTMSGLSLALMPITNALKPIKYLLMPLLVVMTLPFSWAKDKFELITK